MMKSRQLAEKKKLMTETIQNFKNEFMARFNIPLTIYVSEKQDPVKSLSLADMEILADDYSTRHNIKINIMRHRERLRQYVDPRMVFFKICMDMGYGPSELSQYFDWDHATVMHARKRVNNLLDANDYQFTKLFNEISDDIKTRIEFKGVVKSDIVSENNSKSTISPMLYPGIHQSFTNKSASGTEKSPNGVLAH